MSGQGTAARAAELLSAETKRRVRLADNQRRGFESAWNEYYDCYATTTYLVRPLIKLEDIGYHLYLKKNINPHNPSWELPSFRQQKKTLGLSQDKIQAIEARLASAGLLVKESGKGKGQKGENISNDYLLYEPKELGDFLLAVARGEMPGTLNEKGRRKLAELKARFDDHGTPPSGGPAPESGTPPAPDSGTPGAPRAGTPPGPPGGTDNTRPSTPSSQQTGQQQLAVLGAPAPPTAQQAVVVADSPLELLIARGMTPKVAGDLVATMDSAAVARQVEVYDFLREQAPDDPRLSPGRLRRMIEEDWTPPPNFVPAAEREQAEAAAEENRRRRREAHAECLQQQEAAAEAEATLLASLGLHVEDQTAWHVLVDCPRRLPSVFTRALFYAPRDGAPPAIIFRERADYELAMSAVYAQERAEIERRLCDRFSGYIHAHLAGRAPVYLPVDDLQAALRAADGVPAAVEGEPLASGPAAERPTHDTHTAAGHEAPTALQGEGDHPADATPRPGAARAAAPSASPRSPREYGHPAPHHHPGPAVPRSRPRLPIRGKYIPRGEENAAVAIPLG